MDISAWLARFLNPSSCLFCGQSRSWLCPFCLSKIKKAPPACFGCGRKKSSAFCLDCAPAWALDGLIAYGFYADPVLRQLIKSYKYRFIRAAASPLSGLLAQAWQAQTPFLRPETLPVQIVAVPLAKRRQRWRGFNQSELLAKMLAKNLAWPLINGLKRGGRHHNQAELPLALRRANLKGAFYWDGPVPAERDLILVDDVATTGATLNQAARALKAAGAERVWGLVIARGGQLKASRWSANQDRDNNSSR